VRTRHVEVAEPSSQPGQEQYNAGPRSASFLRWRRAVPVRGLSPDYPNILCNSDDVCQMVAGEGHANVAASTMALILSDKFDLTHRRLDRRYS
jgi:Purine nucleoside permease (NUP)